jgi:endonuclease G
MKKLLLLALLPFSVLASPCDNLFPEGKEIVIEETVPLCNTFFVTLYDKTHHAAVMTSEVSQPKEKRTPRTNDFHADTRLENAPTPADYTNSGFDRGHMTPAADASDPKQMSETFLMSNMTPQAPMLNRVAWKQLEGKIREMDTKYVLTGAIYHYPTNVIGKHEVPVPASYWKVVYLKNGKTIAYNATNLNEATVTEVTLDAIEVMAGVKLPH